MTKDELGELFGGLYRNAWALGALTIAAERGLISALASGQRDVTALAAATGLEADTVRAICGVLASLGLGSPSGDALALDEALAARAAGPEAAALLTAELRSTFGSIAGAVQASRDRSARVEGWRAGDASLVTAQATISAATTQQLTAGMSRIPGLDEQLRAEGARFLDVGAGGAGMCIALARHFPTLRVVGLEPSATAAAIARDAVAAAGLAGRVEIREAAGEGLDEAGAYAAAYVAQMFIPDAAIVGVLRATHQALKPGGFLFTGAVAHEGPELVTAVSRLRNAVWGGGVRTAEHVTRLLGEAGFPHVMAMPSPPGMMVPLLARRPEA